MTLLRLALRVAGPAAGLRFGAAAACRVTHVPTAADAAVDAAAARLRSAAAAVAAAARGSGGAASNAVKELAEKVPQGVLTACVGLAEPGPLPAAGAPRRGAPAAPLTDEERGFAGEGTERRASESVWGASAQAGLTGLGWVLAVPMLLTPATLLPARRAARCPARLE